MTPDPNSDFGHGPVDDLKVIDQTQTNKIRQGVTGHNVRYVLVFGIAGVLLGFIVVYAAVFG